MSWDAWLRMSVLLLWNSILYLIIFTPLYKPLNTAFPLTFKLIFLLWKMFWHNQNIWDHNIQKPKMHYVDDKCFNISDIWDFQSSEDMLVLFWVATMWSCTNISEKVTTSIFRMEVGQLYRAQQLIENEENQTGPEKGTSNSPFLGSSLKVPCSRFLQSGLSFSSSPFAALLFLPTSWLDSFVYWRWRW